MTVRLWQCEYRRLLMGCDMIGIKGLLAAQMPKKETADAEEGEHSGGPLPVILAGG